MHDPGLFWATVLLTIVTFWYSYATFRMARIMARDFEIRTASRIAFKPIKLTPDGWNSLLIEQEIVNTGLGALNVEWAEVEWWAYEDSALRHRVMTASLVPAMLKAGEAAIFSFVISKGDLEAYVQPSVKSAEEVVTGLIKYVHYGADGKQQTQKCNLPEAGSNEIVVLVSSLRFNRRLGASAAQ